MKRTERSEIRGQQQSAPLSMTQPVSAARAMAAAEPPLDCKPLFTLEEVGTEASRLMSILTVPRILLCAVVALAVLVPWAVHKRGDDVRLLKAGDLYDAHHWQEAAALFGSIRPSLMAQPDVRLQWAQCLLETDRGDDATACLAPLGPQASTLPLKLRADLAALNAWALIETGQAEGGAAALREILKKAPNDPMSNRALGRYALKAGLMEEAARCYDVLAHNEDMAYALPEFKEATDKIAAALPADELAKLPEQVTPAPEAANPTTATAAQAPKAPAKPAVPQAPAKPTTAQPAAVPAQP